MNRLTQEKRALIVELKAAGKTVREIAEIVGCNREAVSQYSPGAYRRKILGLIDALFAELEAKGIEATDIDALVALHGDVGWSCPIHPEAEPDVDIAPEIDCKLCVRDGLKRHHARRKDMSGTDDSGAHPTTATREPTDAQG